jgi:uncharacterized protein YwbE
MSAKKQATFPIGRVPGLAGMKPALGAGIGCKQIQKTCKCVKMNAVRAFLTKSFAGTGITSRGNV